MKFKRNLQIVEGRIAKFYEEVCLLDQPFVKEATLTVGQLVKTKIAKLGELMFGEDWK